MAPLALPLLMFNMAVAMLGMWEGQQLNAVMGVRFMSNVNNPIAKYFQLLLFVALFQMAPWVASSAVAAVVNGNFVYVEEGDGSLLQYHVHEVDFQGVSAWRIFWDHEQLRAEHYVRRSDGMPLYVKRTNHALKHTVEITYSQDADKPCIYRMRSENEYIERKIWDTELRDLGALPQLLLGLGEEDSEKGITFSAINYADGKVYKLKAERVGFRRVKAADGHVRCAIFDVKLDSWMSTFVGTTRLIVPLRAEDSNFVSYSGPGLDGVAESWKLQLVGKDRSVALLNKE
jgi:outer membrane protein assembly factor BamB